MPLKCTVKMGITAQNMPLTSNSLLSPTKSMVARVTNGNQGKTFDVLSLSTNYNGYNCSKYLLNFKFPIITPKSMVARGNQW